MFSNEINSFYGYILSDMQKMSYINRKEDKKDYSKETIAINDIIGVLFEFKKEGLEISFYKNKICQELLLVNYIMKNYFSQQLDSDLLEVKSKFLIKLIFPNFINLY